MALPWAAIVAGGVSSVIANLASEGIIHISSRMKRGRKLTEVAIGDDGKIDWHSGNGMAADAALHRYVHEHLAEIENQIPDPELKKETFDSSKHTPEEVEHAMVLSLENYVERHPEEFMGDSAEFISRAEMHPNRDNATTLDDRGDDAEVQVLISGPSFTVYVGVAVAVAVSACLISKRQRSATTHQDL